MPSRLTDIEHVFDGGWAPDYGAMATVAVERDGRCRIPWLMEAENVEFEADGTPRKVGGLARIVAILHIPVAGPVRGIYDFWKQGTAGSPIQRRFIHGGTTVAMDTGDGVFSTVYTGLSATSIPHYSALEGYVIIAQTGEDMPMYSDGVTHSTFTSSTPNFAFTEPHKLRMWAAGVDAAPSTLYYSAYEDPTDWTGSGSGDIAISPGDGDRITAIASHRNELFVFKGPYKGSIHRISGSAPTGESDPFTRSDFVPFGLGAAGQHSIFRFGNDLGFMWADGTVHSLNTTERYGDFLEAALSRPLNRWLQAHSHQDYLAKACAVPMDTLGVTRIAMPIDSSTTNNIVLSMDFRFDPPRWSKLAFADGYCECLALGYESSVGFGPTILCGTVGGQVYRMDFASRLIETATGYGCTVTTPFLSYVGAPRRSNIYYGGVRVSPKIADNFTFAWTRDGYRQQTNSALQWTGDVLAPAATGATNFTLGTSTLAGERAITRSLDLAAGGEFQQIQYEITNEASTGVPNDLHVKAILASIKPGAVSTEIMT